MPQNRAKQIWIKSYLIDWMIKSWKLISVLGLIKASWVENFSKIDKRPGDNRSSTTFLFSIGMCNGFVHKKKLWDAVKIYHRMLGFVADIFFFISFFLQKTLEKEPFAFRGATVNKKSFKNGHFLCCLPDWTEIREFLSILEAYFTEQRLLFH